MMKKNQSFMNVRDTDTLNRLARSAHIRVLNRFEYYEAVNGKNGHRYRVHITGQDIVCSCPDARTNPPSNSAKLSLSTTYVSLSCADVSSFSS